MTTGYILDLLVGPATIHILLDMGSIPQHSFSARRYGPCFMGYHCDISFTNYMFDSILPRCYLVPVSSYSGEQNWRLAGQWTISLLHPSSVAMPTRSSTEPDRHYADRTGPHVVVGQMAVYLYLSLSLNMRRSAGWSRQAIRDKKRPRCISVRPCVGCGVAEWSHDGDVALRLPIV